MRKFMKNSAGNAAMMFAAAALPLLLAAGIGIDMVRANHTQTVLQGAADAAALAGASAGTIDDAELQDVVEKYAAANGIDNVLDVVESIEHKLDKNERTFSVRIKGKMDTSLMQLANISNMEIGAYSEVVLGGKALEVVLVLDSTASMGRQGRMDALKVAANQLVEDLMGLRDFGVDVKIGIVPFGDYVNVGTSRSSESWIDVPAPVTTTTPHSCWNTYPNATPVNCRQETTTTYEDGRQVTGTQQVCDWDYGTPVEQCGTQTHTTQWFGCVGSRNDPRDEEISSPGIPYPGIMDKTCGSPILDITDDKNVLKNAVNGLITSGNTYIPAGLIWGWNMIDSGAPLTAARSKPQMKNLGGTKAIVLMTDGANTLSATYPKHDGSDVPTANQKTRDICANIKGGDIMLFSVSFMVDNAEAEDILKQCATDASKNYNADNAAELSKAFSDIGATLSAIRLSK